MKEFSHFDLLDFEFLGDPRLSPAGDSFAFVRHAVLPESDAYRAEIRLHRDGENTVIVEGGTNVHPRFTPDGSWLLYMSDAPLDGEKIGRQVWAIPVEGGRARCLTRVLGGVSSFAISPSGERIAVVVRCDPHEGMVEASKKAEDEFVGDDRETLFAKYNSDVRHITGIKYKFDGMGFLEGRRSHVGVLPFSPDGGALVPSTLTRGDFDHSDPAWSPDERWIAVAACRDENPDDKLFGDIWLFAVDGSEAPRRITRSVGPAASPAWSPDGSTIAYLGHALEVGGGYENTRLWLAGVDGSDPVDLTAGVDVSFASTAVMDMCLSGSGPALTWSEDGGSLYHYTAERGSVNLVRIDAFTGDTAYVTTGDRVIYDADLRPDLGLAVVATATPSNPGEIALVEFDPAGEINLEAGIYGDGVLEPFEGIAKAERVMVESNARLLANRRVREPQRFSVPGPEGDYEIDCWFISPGESVEDVPTVLEIHGGIMGMYTGVFYFELQLLAAAGYGVLYCNPRGSGGYGEEFRASVTPGWGPTIFPDLMAAVDAGIEGAGVDPKRLGVSGGSAGGYMTNWCIGHTDRFSAAVSMRSVANKHSMWGTSDNAYLWGERYGGSPWENAEEYLRQSPIAHLGGATTPTLVIHSEEDYRCPMEQGEQLYMTLKKQGVETEFIRYPRESHGLSRNGAPWHRVHRLSKIVEWFERYLG